jgi:hypothetical protein
MSDFLLAYTLVHTVIALVAILVGLVVLAGLLRAERRDGWTAIFLLTTLLTTLTGFGFPFTGLLPSHIFGILTLILLALAVYARYRRALDGIWRAAYVISAMLALYLNMFVAVVQAFLKIPALHALAPTQTEPAFVIAHAVLFLLLVVFTVLAVQRFHPTRGDL